MTILFSLKLISIKFCAKNVWVTYPLLGQVTRHTHMYEACPNEDEHADNRRHSFFCETSSQVNLGFVCMFSGCCTDTVAQQICPTDSHNMPLAHIVRSARIWIGNMKLCCTQRHHIITCATWGKSQGETYRLLQEVYGDDSLSRSTCRRWYVRACQGNTSCQDLECPGRESTA